MQDFRRLYAKHAGHPLGPNPRRTNKLPGAKISNPTSRTILGTNEPLTPKRPFCCLPVVVIYMIHAQSDQHCVTCKFVP